MTAQTESTAGSKTGKSYISRLLLASLILFCAAFFAFTTSATAATAKQKVFKSPEEALQMMVAAIKSNDKGMLTAIFGPGSAALIASGDDVADKSGREKFVKAYEEKNSLEQQGKGRAMLHVGADDWVFPIPIVKHGGKWIFDTKAGKEEILNRRIGRNELDVIELLETYLDAQREYAQKDRNGNGAQEFARKLVSAPGKHDGLYWEAKEGEEESPLGPLVAAATSEGYSRREGGPTPYKGYFYRILMGQGEHAAGGSYDYLVNGRMVLGFGLVAYPAGHGASGIMTFIVNQDGVVYQKDLGRNTEKSARAMKQFDPDKTWKRVEEGVKQ